MATPSFVRLKNANSRPVRSSVTTITATSSNPSASPPKLVLTPATGLSRTSGSWPQIAPARKRSTKPRAMVRMTTASCDWPNTWRRIVRSSSQPTAARMRIAPMQATQKGKPRCVSLVRLSAVNAPSIMRSPCAKLTCSVAL